ncbi:mycofactocin system protein MftB [Marmoricola endophyticus]|uniref:Mycofactocin system protein MftB n=1 Tax=Marmoricola endophyticus TaxID=2040280 RepID=A0A917F706_9ACTN|nr:mycofactocin biosynthesis chaperone MftB [Marmoricola endophyticus]GGF53695.1 mycofactocin system protein MftB [Marmoricola endophyticus]
MTATPDAERGTPLRVRAEAAWRLSDSVSLRPEPFGALAYDFRTRRLSFLKTPTLVDVVRGLADHDTAGEALTAAGVTPQQESSYLSALTTLAGSGLIEERP